LWLIFPSLLHSVLFVQSHSASVFLRFDPTHFLTFDAKQVHKDMESDICLNLLSSQMHFEPGEEKSVNLGKPIPANDVFVHAAILPNGERIKLLKTLLSSSCEMDCNYCPFRAGRDSRRATFSPDTFAKFFMTLYQRRIAEGLFISSGMVGGGIRTQDKLINTIELLRSKYGFQGYVHLKLMPGCEKNQVERSMQISDRVSINLEAPNSLRLSDLAKHKNFKRGLLEPLQWIEEIRSNSAPEYFWKGHFPSSVTQFVVGATDETDQELINTTDFLFNKLKLKRAYYSSFKPVLNTPLENRPPADPLREYRLYQASFLLRDYRFTLTDFIYDSNGFFSLKIDPKRAWANEHLIHKPVEINSASKHVLIRIPGIGPKSADVIIKNRRDQKIIDISQLSKLGLQLDKISSYILVNGRRPSSQLMLF
jgi:predicted DNA-binding helix-hairpin-helix protein